MTRNEILNNIYCPASGAPGGGCNSEYKSPEARLTSASAVCIDGSRAALALSWSNYGAGGRNAEARRQEALRNVIEKSDPSLDQAQICEHTEHKNFVVVSHGFPIDPDYNIVSKPTCIGDVRQSWRPKTGIIYYLDINSRT